MPKTKTQSHLDKEAEVRAAFGGGSGVPPTPGMFDPSFALGGPDHRLHPGWFIGAGIVLVILGLLACTYPLGLTLASSVFLGILLLIGGVAELVQGFAHSGFGGAANHRALRWEFILMGVCLVVGGLLMVDQPVAGAIFVTAFLGALFVFGGIGRLFWAARHRHAVGWWGIVLSALVTLLLGVLLFVTLPSSGLFFIGIYIAIELLMLGFSALFFGFALRKWQKQNA